MKNYKISNPKESVEIKRLLYFKMKDIAIKTNKNGIIEIHKNDLASQLNVNPKSIGFTSALNELEDENKIKILQRGHVAKNYIWEIIELSSEGLQYEDVIKIQQSTIEELAQKLKNSKQLVNILEHKNKLLNQELQRYKYELIYKY